MKTSPTDKQKEQHAAYERARELSKGKAGPGKDVLDRLEKADDITQVSLGLEPLLEKDDLESRWYGAKACQKWGTEKNVVELVRAAEAAGFGADAVRGVACHALGVIGDPRGIPVVIKRCKDQWDASAQGDELQAALIAFGPKVESDLWPLVENRDRFGRVHAIKALSKVGTEKSLAPLEKGRDWFAQAETDAALATIRARHPKQGK